MDETFGVSLYSPDRRVKVHIPSNLSYWIMGTGLVRRLGDHEYIAIGWAGFSRLSREARKTMRKRAANLRSALTPQESIVLKLFRDNRSILAKFRTQVWVGGFIVDFLFRRPVVGVEIDGLIHERNLRYDSWRDSVLLQKYRIPVIRFTNEDVAQRPGFLLTQTASVIREIRLASRLSKNSSVDC